MKQSRWKPTPKELGQLMRIYNQPGQLRVGKNGVIAIKRKL
jgi:hypothetical protein